MVVKMELMMELMTVVRSELRRVRLLVQRKVVKMALTWVPHLVLK